MQEKAKRTNKIGFSFQIRNLLRQVEVAIANGRTTPQAAREAGITEQTYYC